MAEVEFDLKYPEADETQRRNIAHALTLGLPELGQLPPRPERLKILANGPSALEAPLQAPTLALNGALGLYKDRRRGPTYWAACDPQALVADFVQDAPDGTIFLVNSKCHPDVFDALKGRVALLWHLVEPHYWDLVHDRFPISVGPSITLCSFELGERLGFAAFETWGWDGCYLNKRNHAVGQRHEATNIDIELYEGGPRFRTSTTWAHEGQSAVQRFLNTPRDVRVRGAGFFGALLRDQGLLPSEV